MGEERVKWEVRGQKGQRGRAGRGGIHWAGGEGQAREEIVERGVGECCKDRASDYGATYDAHSRQGAGPVPEMWPYPIPTAGALEPPENVSSHV